MENEPKHTLSDTLQNIRHIVMSLLFIGMGVMMIFAEYFNLEQLIGFDKVFRFLFGGICLLYGGFRLYRGVMKN